jgi:putative phage-type endonuclease
MNREILRFDTQEQWLAQRRVDITSTMSPALFGLSPYMTAFELYHAKIGDLDIYVEETERMKWGKRLEKAIAYGIADDNNWSIRPMSEYVRIPELRIGSSFDFEVIDPIKGKGVLEIKNVDYFQFKKGWINDEAPAHIEIQLQHQLAVLGKDFRWGCIGAFVGGNSPEIFIRDADESFGKSIAVAVKKFWEDIERKAEPNPDFYRDGEAITALYKSANGLYVDLSGDTELSAAIEKFKQSQAVESNAKKEKDSAKAQIHFILKNSGGCITEKYRVSAGKTKGSEGTVITQEMVGQTINKREGYRRLDIRELNEGETK